MTRLVLAGISSNIRDCLADPLKNLDSQLELWDPSRGELNGKTFDRAVHIPAGQDGSPRENCEQELLQLANAGVRRLVLLSSSMVHPARHTHPGMVGEVRPAGAAQDPIASRWLAVEQAARRLPQSVEVLILRTAPTPFPNGRDWASQLLRGKLSATVPGLDPMLQFLDREDLQAAVVLAVKSTLTGACNIAPGPIPLHKALSLAKIQRIPLPYWLQAMIGRGGRAARLRYNWTIGQGRAQELGFEPKYHSADTILRLTGTPNQPHEAYDNFGMDPAYLKFLHKTLMKFLHNIYWRVEYQGMDHIPQQGRALMVGVHRGFMPFDGSMMIFAKAKTGRIPRFLIHPCLVKPPFQGPFISRQGGVIAGRQNADHLLQQDDLVAIFPEGINGAFTPYSKAYELGNFGRDEYVRMALRNRAPIIPFVTVGSAEIFPILAKIQGGPLQRYLEWPYIPLTPTFPLLPFPLPSKWHTKVLEPIHIHERYPAETADDPDLVRQISAEIKDIMNTAMQQMRADRKHIFRGSVF